MTILNATAEAGTNTSTVDTSTYGTDTPWNNVVLGGAALTFSTEQAMKGTKSYKLAFSSTTTGHYMEWVPAGASRTAVARIYFRISGSITGSFQIFTFHKADGTSKLLGVDLLNTGVIRIQDAVSAVAGTTSGSLSSNTWYRMEVSLDNSGGTSAGIAEVRFYTGDSGTAISDMSLSLTGKNFGASNIGAMRVGRWGTNSATATLYFDDCAYEDSTTTFLGPSGVATARPDSDTSNPGNWTTTGAANGYTVLADASDATFIESPNNPQSPCKRRFHLETLSPGPIVVTTRAASTAVSPDTAITVNLYEGTTLIASWSHTMTTVITDFVHSLTSQQNAAITDRSNLYIEYDAGEI